MIRLTCPSCKKVLKSSRDVASGKATCPNCGARLQVSAKPEPATKPRAPKSLCYCVGCQQPVSEKDLLPHVPEWAIYIATGAKWAKCSRCAKEFEIGADSPPHSPTPGGKSDTSNHAS